tara:strand:- start:9176 stop:10393 length:1218 start_codon:yes stop_codon:yes gene_type:complete
MIDTFEVTNKIPSLGIYIHIPFCIKKCGYCDFNTYSGLDNLKSDYTNAVIKEIEGWGQKAPQCVVDSISFGGGTPSEMPAEQLGSILDAVKENFFVSENAEVSLEANPGTSTSNSMKSFVSTGFTRISFGAQSFSDRNLMFLDRIHSAETIATSLDLAEIAGFTSINLDLMYGLREQTLDAWDRDLKTACKLKPDHFSLYNLTVEEGTPLYKRVKQGEVTLPSDDISADFYEYACKELSNSGYVHYELSNWAKPGHESKHNYGYWTWKPYLGVGAGAHGFLEGFRFENIAHPGAYIDALEKGPTPESVILKRERPNPEVSTSDWITTHFRLIKGFEERDFYEEFGAEIETIAGPILSELCEAGVIERFNSTIRLTSRGRLLHSEVAVKFLVYLSGFDLTKHVRKV